MKNNRTQKMLELLRGGRDLHSEEAADLFAVSPATIRRDFERLEAMGLVRRFYGGISLITNGADPALPITIREAWNGSVKRQLALTLLPELPKAGCIFIDGGTTTAQLGRYLTNPELRIITNSIALLRTLEELPEPRAELTLTGGVYNRTSEILLGPEAIRTIESHHAELAVISATALDCDYLYDNRDDAAAIRRAMLENSDRLIVMTDSSKLGRKAYCKNIPTEKITALITDFSREKYPVIAELKKRGVRILMPQEQHPFEADHSP